MLRKTKCCICGEPVKNSDRRCDNCDRPTCLGCLCNDLASPVGSGVEVCLECGHALQEIGD